MFLHADGNNVCGRVRRESATRAMQSWHSKRPPRNGKFARNIVKSIAKISSFLFSVYVNMIIYYPFEFV
jgi:hypothetical protein